MRPPKPHHRPRENVFDGTRPPYRVEIKRNPEPGAREELVDVLFDLLDAAVCGKRE